ncbi:unnamed protein product [Vicia faba]|uniref:Uncharacterized protein n=1 Tax=Vicia faba TaxID=3906 RepID=A0AAV0ZLY7_VICFA|nr:unnamed protein product [Vicia faba]
MIMPLSSDPYFPGLHANGNKIKEPRVDNDQTLNPHSSLCILVFCDNFLNLSVIHTRLMLLHDSRNDDGIKSFFQEVHELYIKTLLNPLYLPGSRITSSHFDTKVRALARKYL